VKISKSSETLKKEQRQAKLATIAEKKIKGKLTLEDIDEKLNIILEILQEK
jgi:hypothetical protein